MKVSVFGAGYVGVVSSACLAKAGHSVIAVDISDAKVDGINRGQSPIVEKDIDGLIEDAVSRGVMSATTNVKAAILETDVSFVSVGTPSAPNGSVSMEAVKSVLQTIGDALQSKSTPHTVVMRSTVPPGTAETCAIPILERHSGRTLGQNLHYYSNPEFLREGTAVQDFHSPAYTLIGAPDGDEPAVMRELYASLEAPFHVTSYRVAESVKYLSNVYHAVKLAFANEAGAVLAAHGVDAPEAFRLFCEDRNLNISPAYLRPGFAFGGSCLPKDIRSFLSLAAAKDIQAPFLRQVLPSNEEIVERAYQEIARRGRQPIALLGLAFKPGTDDLRESPFVTLAERLIGKGYPLKIYDRSVQVARLVGSNKAYIEREIPHFEQLMVNSVGDALAGSKIAVVGHIAKEERPVLERSLSDQAVLDLAGIKSLKSRTDIDYKGICW